MADISCSIFTLVAIIYFIFFSDIVKMKELHSFIEIYFFGVLITHLVISNEENIRLKNKQQYHRAGSKGNIIKVHNGKKKQIQSKLTARYSQVSVFRTLISFVISVFKIYIYIYIVELQWLEH